MTARSQRATRGFAAAAIATFLAAVSHTLGGGDPPPLALILSISLLAAPLATVLVGKTLNLWRLCSAVGLSQVAFHGAFSLVGWSGAGSASAAAPGHQHSTLLLSVGDAVPMLSVTAGPEMIAAHALAAALSVIVLYRGERALSVLRDLVVDFVRRHLIVPVLRPVADEAPRHTSTRFIAALAPAACSIRRRGPPHLSVPS